MPGPLRLFMTCDFFLGPSGAGNIHLKEIFGQMRKLGCDASLFAPQAISKRSGSPGMVFTPTPDLPIIRHVAYQLLLPWALLLHALHKMPDAIYARYSQSTMFPGIVAKILGIPYVVEVDDMLPELFETQNKPRALIMAAKVTTRLNCALADIIVVVTAPMKGMLVEDYGISADKIILIPNGANTEMFTPIPRSQARQRLGLEKNRRYVCYCGSFERYQGIECLVRAFASLKGGFPDLRLLLVGDGPTMPKVRRSIDAEGVSDTTLITGQVSYEMVPLYINASDICAVPKNPIKTGYSPLKLYEYASCGKPVVASDLEGFGFVERERAGSLVPSASPEELAGAIKALLEDPELAVKMGENGRKYVAEHHSWAGAAKELMRVCGRAK